MFKPQHPILLYNKQRKKGENRKRVSDLYKSKKSPTQPQQHDTGGQLSVSSTLTVD